MTVFFFWPLLYLATALVRDSSLSYLVKIALSRVNPREWFSRGMFNWVQPLFQKWSRIEYKGKCHRTSLLLNKSTVEWSFCFNSYLCISNTKIYKWEKNVFLTLKQNRTFWVIVLDYNLFVLESWGKLLIYFYLFFFFPLILQFNRALGLPCYCPADTMVFISQG